MGDEYPSLFRAYILTIFKFKFRCFLTTGQRNTGSEQMSLVQLFVPTEVAHDTVAELGELGNVQFKDVRYILRAGHTPHSSQTLFIS